MDVKQTIKSAFQRLGKKNDIETLDVRFKIVKQNGSLRYYLLNKKTAVKEIKMENILGLGLSMFAGAVNDKLHQRINEVYSSEGVEEINSDVRVYPKKDLTPAAHLFIDDSPVKPIDLDSMI